MRRPLAFHGGLCALLLAGALPEPARAQQEAETATPPAVASAPSEAPAPAPPAEGGAPFGFRGWKTDAPLSIQAQELEAAQKDGSRTLVFRRGVHVAQGDLTIRCNLLEALYPAGSNQPERLVAKGEVRLAQGQQTAQCDEAVYERSAERLTCSGNARFAEGDNELAGQSITIDLHNQTVNVKGGASVVIQPDKLKQGVEP